MDFKEIKENYCPICNSKTIKDEILKFNTNKKERTFECGYKIIYDTFCEKLIYPAKDDLSNQCKNSDFIKQRNIKIENSNKTILDFFINLVKDCPKNLDPKYIVGFFRYEYEIDRNIKNNLKNHNMFESKKEGQIYYICKHCNEKFMNNENGLKTHLYEEHNTYY